MAVAVVSWNQCGSRGGSGSLTYREALEGLKGGSAPWRGLKGGSAPLRITLGQTNGESPGIPYMMEIWPPGHSLPECVCFRICAATSLPPFSTTTAFSEGDLTWISPTLNQTHQLMNVGSKTCVTIQCYMYDGFTIWCSVAAGDSDIRIN